MKGSKSGAGSHQRIRIIPPTELRNFKKKREEPAAKRRMLAQNPSKSKNEELVKKKTTDALNKSKEIEKKLTEILKMVNPNQEENNEGIEEKLNKIQNLVQTVIQKDDQPSSSDRIIPHKNDQSVSKPRVSNQQRSKSRQFFQPDNFSECQFTKYFLIKFSETAKRNINPFKIIKEIETVTGSKPKELTGYNRSSFTIEIKDISQSSTIANVSQVDGHRCEIIPHPQFNAVKGLMYIEETEINDIQEFQDYLKQSYPTLTNITPAPFIRTRSETTQAFTIEFAQNSLPFSIYIPGERTDTRIYPFRNKPLLCKNCFRYNHLSKYCRSPSAICRNCGSNQHTVESCAAASPLCVNCQGDHPAGSKDCPTQKMEEEIIAISEAYKVNGMRARQIYANNNEYVEPPKIKFQTHFDIEMEEQQKRKTSPWILEKSLTHLIGSKPKSIRTKNKTTYTFEVKNEKESHSAQKITKLNNIEVKITANNSIKTEKGLAFLYGYNLSDAESYKESLAETLGAAKVETADWINPKNKNSRALLITFRDSLPSYISIPGEMNKTKIIPYRSRPLICRRCQQFHHTEKYCAGEVICRRCGDEGHAMDECTASKEMCAHCTGEHMAGDRRCVEFKFQEEVLAVQSRDRVSRAQAKVIVQRENPSIRMNYAETAGRKPQAAAKRARDATGNSPERSKRAEMDILVQSPSGRYYSTRITDPKYGTPQHVVDTDRTSESSTLVREESRAIFDSFIKDASSGQ